MEERDDPGGGRKREKISSGSEPEKNKRSVSLRSPEIIEKRFKTDHTLMKNTDQTMVTLTDSVSKRRERMPKMYSTTDKGPFIVCIESTEKSGNNIGRFNDLKIAKDIFNLKLDNIKYIKNKGLNRLSIEFTDHKSANEFIDNSFLKGKGYSMYVPYNFITCKGIVKQIHKDIPVTELMETINSPFEVINIIRLNRKVLTSDSQNKNIATYEPTGTILITFKGIILPKSIDFYRLKKNVLPYVAPVTQCFNCLLYGHTQKLCKNKKKKCFNCGEEDTHSNTTNEQSITYSCMTKCIHCKSREHRSSSKTCPEFNRQRDIKRLIAYENITFFDANRLCPKPLSTEEHILHPQDFPNLPFRSTNHIETNVITPAQRRSTNFTENGKQNFSQVLAANNNQKQTPKGFDRVAHNEALFFPNSRGPNIQINKTSILNTNDRQEPNLNPTDNQQIIDETPSPISAHINTIQTLETLLKNTTPQQIIELVRYLSDQNS
uniref:Pre-C2HC domain-containing protein n=1 Tax=Dendroctonus ponderosae TaxID=77166 RepID=A0AAR5PUQ2_DENPD